MRFKTYKGDFDKEKYELGRVYAAEGNVKAASEVWATIPESSIWSKLAKESESDREWNQKYDKYIDRVPAMQNRKKETK